MMRDLPADLTAEMTVLGCMMLDAKALYAAREALSVEDFTLPSHRLIYERMVSMAEAGKPVDAVTLHSALGPDLERVGGWEAIDNIANVPSTASIDHYCQMVRDRALARAWIGLLTRALSEFYDPLREAGKTAAETLSSAVGLMGKKGPGGPIRLADSVEAAMTRMGEIAAGNVAPGLMTGFEALDVASGGLQPGELWTLAARTSAGKTALALAVALHVAAAGKPVLYVSREMRDGELARRALSRQAKVDSRLLKMPKNLAADRHWPRLHLAAEEMRCWPLWWDTSSTTPADIRVSALRLHAAGQAPSLVVVDYLQLLDVWAGQPRGLGTAQVVGRAAWALKMLAMDLAVPVVLLSQLNRAGAKAEKPPSKTDLRESGDIENHSNVVLLLHRDEDQYGRPADDVRACFDKMRDGPTTPWSGPGAITLDWHGPTVSFVGSRISCMGE